MQYVWKMWKGELVLIGTLTGNHIGLWRIITADRKIVYESALGDTVFLLPAETTITTPPIK